MLFVRYHCSVDKPNYAWFHASENLVVNLVLNNSGAPQHLPERPELPYYLIKWPPHSTSKAHLCITIIPLCSACPASAPPSGKMGACCTCVGSWQRSIESLPLQGVSTFAPHNSNGLRLATSCLLFGPKLLQGPCSCTLDFGLLVSHSLDSIGAVEARKWQVKRMAHILTKPHQTPTQNYLTPV